MSTPRILCMCDLSMAPEAAEALRAVGQLDCREPDQRVLEDIIDQYDVLWIHTEVQVNQDVLDRAARLRVINTASTGTNHIDVDAAVAKGIRVLSITRDYALLDTFTATAECAWMQMLACHRHLRGAVDHVLQGGWDIGGFVGRQLSEKTLGVLGVGRLGKMTVAYGKAFRMRVLGCDKLPFEIDGVEPVDFDTLLAESDAISIHIHLLRENVHLFNEQAFAKMKDGAVLVNTSRGRIIDETGVAIEVEGDRLEEVVVVEEPIPIVAPIAAIFQQIARGIDNGLAGVRAIPGPRPSQTDLGVVDLLPVARQPRRHLPQTLDRAIVVDHRMDVLASGLLPGEEQQAIEHRIVARQ